MGNNNAISLWDADSGLLLKDFGNRGTRGYLIRYSPDGKWMLAGYQDGIHLYDLQAGDELLFLNHAGYYIDGGFTPDCSRVYLATLAEAYTVDFMTDTGDLIESARKYLQTVGYE